MTGSRFRLALTAHEEEKVFATASLFDVGAQQSLFMRIEMSRYWGIASREARSR